MGCHDRHTSAGIRAVCAQNVVASDVVPVAGGVDRMGTNFDTAKTASCGVAQAIVFMIQLETLDVSGALSL